MEDRPYFVFGDLVANTGAVVGELCALVFSPAWNMLVAMLVGMAIGMILSLPLALGLGALFGAMEIMLPVMTTGMVAGMVVSMATSMESLALGRAVELGVTSGIGVMGLEVRPESSRRLRSRR